MVKITQEISTKIANLGVVGAIMVVVIHVPRCEVGHNAFMYKVFPNYFLGAAVPLFFVISGFLIAGHTETKGWWRCEVSKRLKTLVVPYFFLNTILYFGKICCKVVLSLEGLSLLDYLNALGLCPGTQSNNPIIGPLWYVRCLMLAVLTLPIFLPVLKRGRAYAGILVAAFLVVGSCIGDHGGFIFSSVYRLWGIGWFLLGVALRFYGLPDVTRKAGFCFIGLTWAITLAMEFAIPCHVELFKLLLKMMLVVGLWGAVPTSAWPKVLTRNSFAIYAIHGMITLVVCILIDGIDGAGLYGAIFGNPLSYYISPLMLIVSSIVIAECLRRKLPRVSSVILGGR